MFNLDMDLSDVIAPPRDGLNQELLEMYILMDQVFDRGKCGINGAVAGGG